MENDTWINDLREGREAGLYHYIRIHGKSLRFFAYTLLRNKEVAEEIVSDAFIKLWRGRSGFLSPQKVKAFLYIVTRNACYDYLDSPKSRIRHDADMIDDLEHPQPDLLAQIIQTELIELIYQEINNLPKQQASVFRMSYLEGMTTEEISDALGITSNAIFLARSRALSRLRVVFKDQQLIWLVAFLHGVGGDRWLS